MGARGVVGVSASGAVKQSIGLTGYKFTGSHDDKSRDLTRYLESKLYSVLPRRTKSRATKPKILTAHCILLTTITRGLRIGGAGTTPATGCHPLGDQTAGTSPITLVYLYRA